MRIRVLLFALPLGLVPLGVAAQTAPAPGTPQPSAPAQAAEEADEDALPTTFGSFDFGIRGTSTTGDAARYERYRDLGDGLFLERIRHSTQQNGWLIDLGADHVGRKDQRFTGSFVNPGRFKIAAGWDQIPMLLSRTTNTLFDRSTPGVLKIDDAIQASAQAAAANLANFLGQAQTFTLDSRRHLFTAGAEYLANRDNRSGLRVDANVRQINRDGSIPFGGSFGHSQVVETLAPVKHRTTDFDTSAEYLRGNLLVRGGYHGSWFDNSVTSLRFDNPWRVTDITTAGSQGQASLAPSNSFIGVNGLFSYKLPARSRFSLYGSTGTLADTGANLLPMTINTALPVIALDRSATNGKADTSSMNVAFTSRPTRHLDVDLRFRSYVYDNKTPPFLVTQRVGYDNAVSAVTNAALQFSEPFGVSRENFDADVRVMPPTSFVTAGVGFSHAAEERTHRFFEETTDNTFRFVVDSVGSRWFTLRSKYEHSRKRGEGDLVEARAELLAIGEQPGLRHFDIASRDRNRGTLLVTVSPASMVSLNASFGAGKDDYVESEFGLRDNSHRIYSAGFEVAPSEYVAAGVSYSHERYAWLSRSRQANPGVQFDDPSRNWATDAADRGNSLTAHLDLLQYFRNVDITLFADHSRTRGTYNYITGAVNDRTLPEEVVVPTTLPVPTQLPQTTSSLSRANVDVIYSLNERWGIGFSTWHERYRVTDFSLDTESLSRVNPANAVLLGYTYAPYTATTVWGRVICKF
jgi:MtrB/PioB family decaheme-associated outer membrane protein